MADGIAGRVDPPSGLLDFRFLNPFHTFLSEGGEKWLGQRYGYAQLVYMVICIGCLVIIALQSKEIKIFYLIGFAFGLFLNYYSISCLLVPNNHERCFVAVWLSIIAMILFTILLITGKSTIEEAGKNMQMIAGTKKNTEEKIQEEVQEEEIKKDENTQEGGYINEEQEIFDVSNLRDTYTGGANYGSGKKHYHEEEDYTGGVNHGSAKKHYHEEEDYTGGASCGSGKKHSHEEDYIGGANYGSGKKHYHEEEDYTGGANYGSGKKHYHEEEDYTGGASCGSGKKHAHEEDYTGGMLNYEEDYYTGGMLNYEDDYMNDDVNNYNEETDDDTFTGGFFKF